VDTVMARLTAIEGQLPLPRQISEDGLLALEDFSGWIDWQCHGLFYCCHGCGVSKLLPLLLSLLRNRQG